MSLLILQAMCWHMLMQTVPYPIVYRWEWHHNSAEEAEKT